MHFSINIGRFFSVLLTTFVYLLVNSTLYFYTLLALPYFEGENPEIVYKADRAEITWPIHNLDSVNTVLIEVCASDRSVCNSTVNITSPEIQPYVVSLPEQDTKTYVLHFTSYDGKDVVYTQQKQVTEGKLLSFFQLVRLCICLLVCLCLHL